MEGVGQLDFLLAFPYLKQAVTRSGMGVGVGAFLPDPPSLLQPLPYGIFGLQDFPSPQRGGLGQTANCLK